MGRWTLVSSDSARVRPVVVLLLVARSLQPREKSRRESRAKDRRLSPLILFGSLDQALPAFLCYRSRRG